MTQPSQADILAALQAQSSSSRKRPSTSSYAEHADPYTSLTTPSTSAPSATASSSRLNATRLYCPREGCGSLILLEQTGEWLTAEADAIPIEDKSPFTSSPQLPSSTPGADGLRKAGGYWRINGGPMAFENIGYSRSGDIELPSTAPGLEQDKGRKVKWLICAECDLGPVGWSFEGGQDSYLAVDRVRYGDKK